MKIKVLREMPYAQAHIREYENEKFLISYTTLVAEIKKDENDNHWLKVNGLYSMTTRRHIMAFIKEYCDYVCFDTVKQLVNDRLCLNLDTGEIITWQEWDTQL